MWQTHRKEANNEGSIQKNQLLARGGEVCIGIDVNKESWQVTVRTEGEDISTGRLPSQYHALEQLTARLQDAG